MLPSINGSVTEKSFGPGMLNFYVMKYIIVYIRNTAIFREIPAAKLNNATQFIKVMML